MQRANTGAKFAGLIEAAEQDVQRRRRRNVTTVLIATAAVVALIVLALSLGINRQESIQPARTPTDAEQVAAGFLDAYAASDGRQMANYLAKGAYLDLRSVNGRRWLEAIGYQRTSEACLRRATTPAGIRVVCSYDFQALGSEQLGRGPFTSDKLVTVVGDGQILAAKEVNLWRSNGFTDQMWLPFSGFVVGNYPRDAAAMYADWPSTTTPSWTDHSIALWAKHTKDYVDEYQ